MDFKLTEENIIFIQRQSQETGLSNSDVINTVIEIFRDTNRDDLLKK